VGAGPGDGTASECDALDVDATWGPEREVPADVLLALLTGAEEVHPRGVRIRGARIVGEFSWQWQHLVAPLELLDCVIDQPIVLDHGELAGLTLKRCRVPGLSAEEVTSHSTVNLTGSAFAGVVVLRDSRVIGAILLAAASIAGADWGSERCALLGTRLRVSGVMSLERGSPPLVVGLSHRCPDRRDPVL